ncbi:cyclic pyranopterin monophosphate synthase MoaC [uncultured Microbacterium sp.]|uniref:cyclic pyranopterin monophosphate synthase MoaC n=1 Tax=uncultured Microbacterium sp. TaxID=191216 RepID=UPI0025DE9B4E|nr:cyclic pyranopterin monophosphate synthase MoaC [uncultured Microbacterium sp.]
MVDVTDKAVTRREATAQAVLRTTAEVVAKIADGSLPKGEALGTARIAGIMGAKQTSALIPLCHPLPLSKVEIDFEPQHDAVRILATAVTTGVTGVEMEALTAVSIAALTLYDMIKAVDKHAVIDDVRVLAKSGGKSGDWSIA